MRLIATILFTAGVALITHGFTYWVAFRQFVPPVMGSYEGDSRSFTAFEHMAVAVGTGIILILFAAYCFTHARQKNQPNLLSNKFEVQNGDNS